MYANVTPIDPPNRASSRRGERPSATTLASDCLSAGTTRVVTRRRPCRVAMARPTRASTTAMTTSSRLLLGNEKPLPPRPAQAKNTISSTMWTIAPATTLRPIPVTASADGTPAFCR